MIEEADGGRKIKLEFNLEGFHPEDLSLKITPENTLKIEAVQEESKGGSTSKKEFRSFFDLLVLYMELFSRVHATLQVTVSIGLSIRRSVRPSHLTFWRF